MKDSANKTLELKVFPLKKRAAHQETWTLYRLNHYGRVTDVDAFSRCLPVIRRLSAIIQKLRNKGVQIASVKENHPGGWHVVYYLKDHRVFKMLKNPNIYHEN